jgi:5'-nucleotidase (lipoprotein e(P4) family)
MRSSTKVYSIIFLTIILFGCSNNTDVKTNDKAGNNDYLLMATLFQQQAAEKRALSYQAYNTARLMLDNALKSARLTKKLAVVVDIDETVLDNSPFEAKSIIENSDYPAYWDEWCEKEEAIPIAGAVEFLNYANSKGVDVFYITNRKEHLKKVTLNNLVAYGFPNADDDHLLMRTSTSDKEPRRKTVEETHQIVILMGDNLGDFANIFDIENNRQRSNLVDSLKAEFGSRFIMLPNPMYGNWSNNLLLNYSDLSKKEKIEILKRNLRSF